MEYLTKGTFTLSDFFKRYLLYFIESVSLVILGWGAPLKEEGNETLDLKPVDGSS